jgi:hypothetical protein
MDFLVYAPTPSHVEVFTSGGGDVRWTLAASAADLDVQHAAFQLIKLAVFALTIPRLFQAVFQSFPLFFYGLFLQGSNLFRIRNTRKRISATNDRMGRISEMYLLSQSISVLISSLIYSVIVFGAVQPSYVIVRHYLAG